MIDKVYALKSYRLLKDARAIFGSGLIKNAWKLGLFSTHNKDYWLKVAKTPYQSDCDGSIDIGGISIVLQFNNGKIVEFSSSEWGSISKFKREMIELD